MNAEDNVSGPLSRERERVRVRARTLRESATDAETLLWYHLRDRRELQTPTPALSRKREREQDTKDPSP
jgi:hypothetical protein